jgi:Kef-type K+ transport system membrane component KefB
MAYLTGRIKPGEPTLIEALGIVFLCGGLAIWLHVSFLFASMILGVTVANLAHHHARPFNAIDGIEWPFMVIFFILSGASLRTETLLHVGLIGTGYIVLRVLGRLLGAWVGGMLSSVGSLLCRWMGVALMPQAGVALSMALVVIEKRPDLGNMILPVVIASTIVFEVIGPIFTRMGLVRAGDAYRK